MAIFSAYYVGMLKCDQSISEHLKENKALIVHYFVAEGVFFGCEDTCQIPLKYLSYFKSYC